MKTTPCKGCGKPIVFAATNDGKRVPLDPRPPVYVAVVVKQLENGDTEVDTVARMYDAMVSHFATCPKASEFSKGKRTA